MAGEEGLEPSLPEPESGVLPLDDSPSVRPICDQPALSVFAERNRLASAQYTTQSGLCKHVGLEHEMCPGGEPGRDLQYRRG